MRVQRLDQWDTSSEKLSSQAKLLQGKKIYKKQKESPKESPNGNQQYTSEQSLIYSYLLLFASKYEGSNHTPIILTNLTSVFFQIYTYNLEYWN